jgi:membrane protease YdiL (CAAX protease family)
MPDRRLVRTALLVLAAMVITAALDANGLWTFSALPLLPLAGLGWLLDRHSRRAMGLAWGRPRDYGPALLHPVLVLGTLAAAAFATGAAEPEPAGWGAPLRDFAIMAAVTIPVALLTEEGFFRGWLPASLAGAGMRWRPILVTSSAAFALWHVPVVVMDTGFELPAARVPVFLANAAVLGAIWGALRLASGSILVASVAHGLWNGGAYVLFGYGPKVGALGIANTTVLGPESGLAGLALNVVFLLWLLRRCRVGHSGHLAKEPNVRNVRPGTN